MEIKNDKVCEIIKRVADKYIDCSDIRFNQYIGSITSGNIKTKRYIVDAYIARNK